jgi:hypothetical protein
VIKNFCFQKKDSSATKTKNRMNYVILMSLALLVALPVRAEVFKCPDATGKIAYQAKPCEGGEALKVETQGPPTDPYEAAALSGKIMVGMSAAKVRHAWGQPSTINRSMVAGRSHEQWVYRLGNRDTQYVYLENDRVTSWQQ